MVGRGNYLEIELLGDGPVEDHIEALEFYMASIGLYKPTVRKAENGEIDTKSVTKRELYGDIVITNVPYKKIHELNDKINEIDNYRSHMRLD